MAVGEGRKRRGQAEMGEEFRHDGQEEHEHAGGDFAVARDGHVHGVAHEVVSTQLAVVVDEAHDGEAAGAALVSG